MKESPTTDASFLEQAVVRILLDLSRQLEQKPASPPNARLKTMLRAGELTLLLGLIGIGGTRLYQFLNTAQARESASAPATQPNPVFEANSDIITDNFNRLRIIENIFFYQPSDQMRLLVNQPALVEWLAKNGKPQQTMAFIFIDPQIGNRGVQGAGNWWIDLESGWINHASGSTKEELYSSMSAYLSASVAATLELTAIYGVEPTILMLTSNSASEQLNTLFSQYKHQFQTGQLPYLIRVMAVNQSWLAKKIGTAQR